MTSIIGVDGCRGGWYAAVASKDGAAITGCEYKRFSELIEAHPDAVVGIDIPIGLLDAGTRGCDQLARDFLKPHRTASVFTAPLRDVLQATTHAHASQMRMEREGKGMSIQAFAIMAKVREVDDALQTAPRSLHVYEVHPEVSFARLNDGVPMPFSKKSAAGREARVKLLDQQFPGIPKLLMANRRPAYVAADDVLDALAALWTAIRIARGSAIAFDSVPTHDRVGRRMSILS